MENNPQSSDELAEEAEIERMEIAELDAREREALANKEI